MNLKNEMKDLSLKDWFALGKIMLFNKDVLAWIIGFGLSVYIFWDIMVGDIYNLIIRFIF